MGIGKYVHGTDARVVFLDESMGRAGMWAPDPTPRTNGRTAPNRAARRADRARERAAARRADRGAVSDPAPFPAPTHHIGRAEARRHRRGGR